jgi:hypothetical protein
MRDQLFELMLNFGKLTLNKKINYSKLDSFNLDELEKTACPVFVLSPGRSATQSIARKYLFHPKIISFHKNSPELKIFAESLSKTSRIILAKQFQLARSEIIIDAHLCGLKYLETNHNISIFGAAIIDIFPNAKFIWMDRDRNSFIESSISRGSFKNRFNDRGKIRGDFAYSNFDNIEKRRVALGKNYDIWKKKILEIQEEALPNNFHHVTFGNLKKELHDALIACNLPYNGKLKKRNHT